MALGEFNIIATVAVERSEATITKRLMQIPVSSIGNRHHPDFLTESDLEKAWEMMQGDIYAECLKIGAIDEMGSVSLYAVEEGKFYPEGSYQPSLVMSGPGEDAEKVYANAAGLKDTSEYRTVAITKDDKASEEAGANRYKVWAEIETFENDVSQDDIKLIRREIALGGKMFGNAQGCPSGDIQLQIMPPAPNNISYRAAFLTDSNLNRGRKFALMKSDSFQPENWREGLAKNQCMTFGQETKAEEERLKAYPDGSVSKGEYHAHEVKKFVASQLNGSETAPAVPNLGR